MKRSEMLKILEDVYTELIEEYGYFGDDLEAFDYILNRIEEAGMIPPPNYHEQDRDAKVTCNKAKQYMTWESEE